MYVSIPDISPDTLNVLENKSGIMFFGQKILEYKLVQTYRIYVFESYNKLTL